MEKRFSVSMCVYYKDDPRWFETSVDSILNQTVKPTEVVLVVDGPVPGELKKSILKYESYDFFKIIWLEKNMGHGIARRTSFENCSNEIIALMDADDISVPTRFEKQIALFESQQELSIVGGNISEFVLESEHKVYLLFFYRDRCSESKYVGMSAPHQIRRIGREFMKANNNLTSGSLSVVWANAILMSGGEVYVRA